MKRNNLKGKSGWAFLLLPMLAFLLLSCPVKRALFSNFVADHTVPAEGESTGGGALLLSISSTLPCHSYERYAAEKNRVSTPLSAVQYSGSALPPSQHSYSSKLGINPSVSLFSTWKVTYSNIPLFLKYQSFLI